MLEVRSNADIHHVWVSPICRSGALLTYNRLMPIRRHLGANGLLRLYLAPLPDEQIGTPSRSLSLGPPSKHNPA
jgi:hypothetical protein